MFAVSGWKVATEKPKKQTLGAIAGAEEPAKKKKRKTGPPKLGPVTGENIDELWQKVIVSNDGGSTTGSKDRKPSESKKTKKKNKTDGAKVENYNAPTTPKTNSESKGEVVSKETSDAHSNIAPEHTQQANGLSNKEKKKLKGIPKGPLSLIATFSSTSLPLSSSLTPHQQQLRSKLLASRFRHLNEQFYTSSSDTIFSQITDSPSLLEDYHVGFRQAASHWPENPLDSFITNIRERGKVRRKGDERGEPLPRDREGVSHIVDVGCGDARLERTLLPQAKKLGLDLSSFDLAPSTDGIVKAADASNLPLADGSVQVVIFCLSLMGSNWPSFVDEASRVLSSRGGELWVAEIKSRFIEPGKKPLPAASLSRKRKAKPGPDRDDDDGEAEAAGHNRVEKEGETADRTPIEPFVAVLKRRGFELKREGVHRANKMFVRFEFVKRNRDREVPGELDEGRVLKACSYKLR